MWTLDRGEETQEDFGQRKLRRDEEGVIDVTGLWLLARAESNKIIISMMLH